MNKILLLLLLWCVAVPVFAQTPGPGQQAQLEAYLANRDIDQQELNLRLLAAGINVNEMTEAQLIATRPRIEAIITQMEQEQAQANEEIKTNAARANDEIEKAVEEGASVEEAISEVTTELANEDDPSSRIYGHQIFRNKSLELYRATDQATPPETYPLKSGDEIAVSIFGASQEDLVLRINEAGFVILPNQIRINLAGIPLGDARTLLASRLKSYYAYRDGQIRIRVQVARTLSVNIFGEVENSGNFTISALNTGFNALVAAGGPTERGSVRNIQLVRGDETIILDVYEYLRNPVQRADLFMNDNTAIYVPLAEKIVTLQGGVVRPMKYELKTDETLEDLIAFAGNPLATAETSLIRITRYVKGTFEVINVDLAEQPDFALLNGDVISVPIIQDPLENYVTIEGSVLLPGRYAFTADMTTSELIQKGRLRPGARTDVAFLYRSNDDGTYRLERINLGGADAGAKGELLKRGDRLQILSQRAFTDASSFSVQGAVRRTAGSYPFPADGALSLEEAILLAGGTEPNALPEVMVIRTPLNNRENRLYERVNLLQNPGFTLQPLDQIIVYTNERFSDPTSVSISGAVRQPGAHRYSPSLKFSDLLYLGGGTRQDAALDRIEIYRLVSEENSGTKTLLTTLTLDEANNFELQPYDEIVVRSKADYELITNVELRGEVRYPGKYALLKDDERLSDVIARAGGLTDGAFPAGATLFRNQDDIGFVVLDLDKTIQDAGSPANVVLLAGDILSIPKKNELVTIYTQGTLATRFGRDSTTASGALQIAYQGDRRADWYVDNYAGGFSNKARRRWTTVEYANGQIKETQNYLLSERYPRIQPGSVIRVGLRPEKVKKTRRAERFDWIRLATVVLPTVTTVALILSR